MKYMLLIYSTEAREEFDALAEEEQNAIFAEYMAIQDEPDVLGGDQLQPTDSATTVRVANGETLTTDGPFSETKEVLGGYYMLEADNLDRALEVAARIPAARMGGAIEVRPLVER
ncbi:MAG TPA: YciI family protein [Solirubrobacterales bacterium]|jgi:hypothetical protein|nr:YciI family protein [Solirubrobacterales bacterium]